MKSDEQTSVGNEAGLDLRALAADVKAMRAALESGVAAQRHERKRPHHMGARSLLFLLETARVMREHGELLPPVFDQSRFEQRVAQAAALHEFLQELRMLSAVAQDAFLVLTRRSLPDARLVRDSVRAAALTCPQAAHLAGKIKSRAERGPSVPLAAQIQVHKAIAQPPADEAPTRGTPRNGSEDNVALRGASRRTKQR